MDEYMKSLSNFVDLGEQMAMGAASFYNVLIEKGVPEQAAATVTCVFVTNIFETARRQQATSKPSEDSLKDG